jgi:O-methyltransferase
MAAVKQYLKRATNSLLTHARLRLMGEREVQAFDDRYRQVVGQLCTVMIANVLPNIEVTEERLRRLCELLGTEVPEGLYLLDRLLFTMALPGDVCEMGVAQGATSALIASELSSHPTKNLWLYDSFEGLPEPSEQDVLIDDPLNLGDLAHYAGEMAVPVKEVLRRLGTTTLPTDRVRIVKGFLDSSLPSGSLPPEIAFAYVDFDFYQPIFDALTLIHPRLVAGGIIMVDDYGYLSAGAKQATDEFFACRGDEYSFYVGPLFAGHFAVLTRTICPDSGS